MQHTISSGETLSGIASRHGITIRAILAVNPQITDMNLIRTGQVITVPAGDTPPAPDTYQVRSGDTLAKIARHFDVTLSALRAANPQVRDADIIRIGEVLSLPDGARPSDRATDVESDGDLPRWLSIARREMDTGVDEVRGTGHNPRILEYHATTTLPAGAAGQDETPWCSSFVNWCVRQAGLRGTDSALARSWLDWGDRLPRPRRGAVAVFQRHDPNNSRAGHVAFYWGRASGGRILVLGGNQANQVSITGYPSADLLGFRWAA